MSTGTDDVVDGKPVPSKIILVSCPGFRQDTLKALIYSLPGVDEIFLTECLDECISRLGKFDPALVVIDHSINLAQFDRAVPLIREKNPKAWILMLVGHPRDTFAFANPRPDSILCDGFSSASLMEEIEKAFPVWQQA